MKIEITSHDMVNAVIKDLLYHHECEHIVESIPIQKLQEHRSQKPGIQYANIKEWADVRVMKKYDLNIYFPRVLFRERC